MNCEIGNEQKFNTTNGLDLSTFLDSGDDLLKWYYLANKHPLFYSIKYVEEDEEDEQKEEEKNRNINTKKHITVLIRSTFLLCIYHLSILVPST